MKYKVYHNVLSCIGMVILGVIWVAFIVSFIIDGSSKIGFCNTLFLFPFSIFMVLLIIIFFTGTIETKDDALIQTIKIPFFIKVNVIPYNKITRISRVFFVEYHYSLTADIYGVNFPLSLVGFNAKKILRDVIPRVNRTVVDKDVLKALKM